MCYLASCLGNAQDDQCYGKVAPLCAVALGGGIWVNQIGGAHLFQ